MVLVVMLRNILSNFEASNARFCTKSDFCLSSKMSLFRWLVISRPKLYYYICQIINMVSEQVLVAAYGLIHGDWSHRFIMQTIKRQHHVEVLFA